MHLLERGFWTIPFQSCIVFNECILILSFCWTREDSWYFDQVFEYFRAGFFVEASLSALDQVSLCSSGFVSGPQCFLAHSLCFLHHLILSCLTEPNYFRASLRSFVSSSTDAMYNLIDYSLLASRVSRSAFRIVVSERERCKSSLSEVKSSRCWRRMVTCELQRFKSPSNVSTLSCRN